MRWSFKVIIGKKFRETFYFQSAVNSTDQDTDSNPPSPSDVSNGIYDLIQGNNMEIKLF